MIAKPLLPKTQRAIVQPSILSIGKSLPTYALSQLEIAERLNDLLQLPDEEAWLLEKIYKNSEINKRYSVLPDIMHPKSRFSMPSQGIRFVGMSERNADYKKEAPKLAEKSAKEALTHWGRNPKEITHIISVSCTGVMTPGIEFFLSRQFNLAPDVSLLGINFMGCFGAFKALKVASKIAKADPKNRILLVSTELCTLHFKPRGDIESIVIQSLFADGSAAVIVGCAPLKDENPIFELVDESSYAIQDTMEDMTWDASDEGFDMTLSKRVPLLISEHIGTFVKKLVGSSNALHEYEWAIHPGGKTIIEAIEKTLSLDRSLTASSWNVLRNFGNLSSASFLYVLEDIYKRHDSKDKIVGLGFGPGLSVEGLLLYKSDNLCGNPAL